MLTRQDFKATAALIRAMPRGKRLEFFHQWCDKFTDANIRFDEDRFAKACGVVFLDTQSEYRTTDLRTQPKPKK